MSSPSLRAARYLRVSRVDQRADLQDDETEELVKRRGWKLVDTYEDHGVSGSRDRRPELDRLMGDLRRRRFDVLVVWRSDRAFRSLRHMVVLLDELGSRNVSFVSVTEPFDTSTPSGKLLLHMVSAMAEFERGILQERTRAGLAAARRRGARLGRPRARLDEDHVRELRAGGMSVREIASSMGVGSSTIQRRLGAVGGER